MSEFVALLRVEVDRAEAAAAAPVSQLNEAVAELEAARKAVEACAEDDPAVPAVELMKRRRKAAERLELATIEHGRAEKAAAEKQDARLARLFAIGRDLESLVAKEIERRQTKVITALKEILGSGSGRLPSNIENSASWVDCLRAADLALRNGGRNLRDQIAILRQTFDALEASPPVILANR